MWDDGMVGWMLIFRALQMVVAQQYIYYAINQFNAVGDERQTMKQNINN